MESFKLLGIVIFSMGVIPANFASTIAEDLLIEDF